MASSRQSLGISGENVFHIPSLPVANLAVTDAGKYAAITLFAERAAAVDSRFLLTDENVWRPGRFADASTAFR
ncbi:MAG TPA: hypothetical protein VGF86_12320 [Candidatus Tumulicola sp.]